MIQTLASSGKNEFRITSAASPYAACQRSSGQSGGVAAGAVVDNEIYTNIILHGFIHNSGRVLDHLRVQHAADHLRTVKADVFSGLICESYELGGI